MPSTTANIASLISYFPEISFVHGDDFRWMPDENTIEYSPRDPHAVEHLLHEVAHAKLGHISYDRDIELIALEREAWRYAKIELAPLFHASIDADLIEDDLDTYRDWLHARSTCPQCQATGIQTSMQLYTCIACHAKWRVNAAMRCGLRRYIQKTP